MTDSAQSDLLVKTACNFEESQSLLSLPEDLTSTDSPDTSAAVSRPTLANRLKSVRTDEAFLKLTSTKSLSSESNSNHVGSPGSAAEIDVLEETQVLDNDLESFYNRQLTDSIARLPSAEVFRKDLFIDSGISSDPSVVFSYKEKNASSDGDNLNLCSQTNPMQNEETQNTEQVFTLSLEVPSTESFQIEKNEADRLKDPNTYSNITPLSPKLSTCTLSKEVNSCNIFVKPSSNYQSSESRSDEEDTQFIYDDIVSFTDVQQRDKHLKTVFMSLESTENAADLSLEVPLTELFEKELKTCQNPVSPADDLDETQVSLADLNSDNSQVFVNNGSIGSKLERDTQNTEVAPSLSLEFPSTEIFEQNVACVSADNDLIEMEALSDKSVLGKSSLTNVRLEVETQNTEIAAPLSLEFPSTQAFRSEIAPNEVPKIKINDLQNTKLLDTVMEALCFKRKAENALSPLSHVGITVVKTDLVTEDLFQTQVLSATIRKDENNLSSTQQNDSLFSSSQVLTQTTQDVVPLSLQLVSTQIFEADFTKNAAFNALKSSDNKQKRLPSCLTDLKSSIFNKLSQEAPQDKNRFSQSFSPRLASEELHLNETQFSDVEAKSQSLCDLIFEAPKCTEPSKNEAIDSNVEAESQSLCDLIFEAPKSIELLKSDSPDFTRQSKSPRDIFQEQTQESQSKNNVFLEVTQPPLRPSPGLFAAIVPNFIGQDTQFQESQSKNHIFLEETQLPVRPGPSVAIAPNLIDQDTPFMQPANVSKRSVFFRSNKKRTRAPTRFSLNNEEERSLLATECSFNKSTECNGSSVFLESTQCNDNIFLECTQVSTKSPYAIKPNSNDIYLQTTQVPGKQGANQQVKVDNVCDSVFLEETQIINETLHTQTATVDDSVFMESTQCFIKSPELCYLEKNNKNTNPHILSIDVEHKTAEILPDNKLVLSSPSIFLAATQICEPDHVKEKPKFNALADHHVKLEETEDIFTQTTQLPVFITKNSPFKSNVEDPSLFEEETQVADGSNICRSHIDRLNANIHQRDTNLKAVLMSFEGTRSAENVADLSLEVPLTELFETELKTCHNSVLRADDLDKTQVSLADLNSDKSQVFVNNGSRGLELETDTQNTEAVPSLSLEFPLTEVFEQLKENSLKNNTKENSSLQVSNESLSAYFIDSFDDVATPENTSVIADRHMTNRSESEDGKVATVYNADVIDGSDSRVDPSTNHIESDSDVDEFILSSDIVDEEHENQVFHETFESQSKKLEIVAKTEILAYSPCTTDVALNAFVSDKNADDALDTSIGIGEQPYSALKITSEGEAPIQIGHTLNGLYVTQSNTLQKHISEDKEQTQIQPALGDSRNLTEDPTDEPIRTLPMPADPNSVRSKSLLSNFSEDEELTQIRPALIDPNRFKAFQRIIQEDEEPTQIRLMPADPNHSPSKGLLSSLTEDEEPTQILPMPFNPNPSPSKGLLSSLTEDEEPTQVLPMPFDPNPSPSKGLLSSLTEDEKTTQIRQMVANPTSVQSKSLLSNLPEDEEPTQVRPAFRNTSFDIFNTSQRNIPENEELSKISPSPSSVRSKTSPSYISDDKSITSKLSPIILSSREESLASCSTVWELDTNNGIRSGSFSGTILSATKDTAPNLFSEHFNDDPAFPTNANVTALDSSTSQQTASTRIKIIVQPMPTPATRLRQRKRNIRGTSAVSEALSSRPKRTRSRTWKLVENSAALGQTPCPSLSTAISSTSRFTDNRDSSNTEEIYVVSPLMQRRMTREQTRVSSRENSAKPAIYVGNQGQESNNHVPPLPNRTSNRLALKKKHETPVFVECSDNIVTSSTSSSILCSESERSSSSSKSNSSDASSSQNTGFTRSLVMTRARKRACTSTNEDSFESDNFSNGRVTRSKAHLKNLPASSTKSSTKMRTAPHSSPVTNTFDSQEGLIQPRRLGRSRLMRSSTDDDSQHQTESAGHQMRTRRKCQVVTSSSVTRENKQSTSRSSSSRGRKKRVRVIWSDEDE